MVSFLKVVAAFGDSSYRYMLGVQYPERVPFGAEVRSSLVRS